MIRRFAGLLASAAILASASSAVAESKPPLKLGLILDMSGPYADITGPGSVVAGKMAAEDFGGEVLGRKIEILSADHFNKADIAATTAREWFDNQGVEAIMDVAASATALAANEIAKARNKILLLSGPGAIRITNEACGPYTVHWAYDTYSLAKGTATAMTKQGGDSWFFITADYAFGQDLEKDATTFVKANGGKVLGDAKHPLNAPDFSSYLLQAQSSGAKVVGLADAGADAITAVKQASEFGLTKSGQRLAMLLGYISDVESLGLPIAKGLVLTEPFYWDLNDETRAWSRRFFDKFKKMPTAAQAGVYSSTMHYLKAVKQAGTTDSAPVMKIMKETPVNDFFAHNGIIREDGRMVHDMYLFQVKAPEESKGKYDDYKVLATIPGKDAFLPLSESKCPLVKK
ncbi:MAG: ABC transporter substrate-binding protein [Hyphomicrobiales bacterium]|nr:ABC transporter substrate-binding protein [Hyphomicrobiales bacterium]